MHGLGCLVTLPWMGILPGQLDPVRLHVLGPTHERPGERHIHCPGAVHPPLRPVCGIPHRLLFIGRYEKKRIRQTGIPAEAVVLRLRTTGTRFNDLPLVKIDLTVQPDSGTPFNAATGYLLSDYELSQMLPGMRVPVYYIEKTGEVALIDL